MNVLSTFDGHSTGYGALLDAGIKIDNYFASEIEESAMKISKHNYPQIIQIGDVKKIDVSTLPRIDLVIGGSPCQGFSRAGKCLNFNDPRSALFFEYARILDEIRAINPDVKFLLENVRMKKEWEQIITDRIGVAGQHINSKLLSAQNRERVYWTNIPIAEIVDQEINLVDILEEVDTTGFIEKDGLLFDPSFSEKAIDLVSVVDGEVRIKQSTNLGYIVAHDGDGISLDFPTSKSRRGRVIDKKSSTITRVYNASGCYHNGVIRKFTITELERLQTLPDGYTNAPDVKERERVFAIGNGWTRSVIAHIFRGLNG